MTDIDKVKLNVLLKWYIQEVGNDLVAVFVLDREGVVVEYLLRSAIESKEGEFIESIRNLMGLILRQIAENFTLGNFGAGTFDTAEYRFIFCEAGPDFIFVNILDALALAEPVFPYVYIAAEKIARIFDGRPVSPVIPKIITSKNTQDIKRKVDTLQKLNVPFEDYVYKLILGGDGGVGKTSMIQHFIEGVFRTDYKATIGTSITKKECSFKGLESKVRFMIWDLAGQQQFNRIRPHYYTNADAAILVYDIARRDTFDTIKKWFVEIKQGAKSNIIMILVGNKTDLKESRVVSINEAESLAKELNISYIETSAMTGENINDAFKIMALQLIKKYFETIEVIKISTDKIPIITQKTLKNSDLGSYNKMQISKIWINESDFISWLERNIECLNEALDLVLSPIERHSEQNDDLLTEDKLGNKVIVGVQFGKGDPAQIIKMLKFLAYYDTKKAVLICEQPLSEHEKIVTWLNENTFEDVLFYLLKIEVFKVDNSHPTPLLIKICGPSEDIKRIKSLKTDLSYTERKRIEFWEKLIEKIYSIFPEHANITPVKTSWNFCPTGKKGLRYVYIINNDWAAIRLYFDNTNKEINQRRFKEFESKKDEINQEFEDISYHLPGDLEWNYSDNQIFQSITYRFDEAGLKIETLWDELQYKMIDAMKCLVNIMQKHIDNLKD